MSVTSRIDETRLCVRRLRGRDRGDRRPARRGRTVSTIFFGGGTPFLDASRRTVAAILDNRWPRHWRTRAPDVRDSRSRPIPRAGGGDAPFSRLSGGRRQPGLARACSRSTTRLLKQLGRLPHGARGARRCRGRRAGIFERYSFDLIYARSGQSVAGPGAPSSAAPSREAAEHLSLYQLTIEPDTPFAALHAGRKTRAAGPTISDATSTDLTLDHCAGCRPAGPTRCPNHCAGRAPSAATKPGLLALWRILPASVRGRAMGVLVVDGARPRPPRPRNARKPG